MKVRFFAIVVLACLISGCAVDTTKIDPAMPMYPGLSWSMSPGEVVEALELDVSEYTIQSDLLTVTSPDCFGVPAEKLVIQFSMTDENSYTILQMGIVYPDDADMDAVYRELCELYGTPEKMHRFYILDLSVAEDIEQGRVNETYQIQNGVPVVSKSSDDGMKYWSGTHTLRTYLDEEELSDFCQEYYADLSEDIFREYADNQTLTYLFWTDSGGDDYLPQNAKNMVAFKSGSLFQANTVRKGLE